jgi:hypothetical protein
MPVLPLAPTMMPLEELITKLFASFPEMNTHRRCSLGQGKLDRDKHVFIKCL